jgi:hypothetical protein
VDLLLQLVLAQPRPGDIGVAGLLGELFPGHVAGLWATLVTKYQQIASAGKQLLRHRRLRLQPHRHVTGTTVIALGN